MYNELFNLDLQNEMKDFFLKDLSKDGIKKNYNKNEIINPTNADAIYIVVDGQCRQKLTSFEGEEITFFWLGKGTIFGEMDYFDAMRTCVVTECMENSVISIVSREVLEQRLTDNPQIYRYFLHSEARKYRLLMMSMADSKFNNSLGQLASFLNRILEMQNGKLENNIRIEQVVTHQELANRIGCTRITLTKCINLLKDQGIIEYQGRKIVIKKWEGLREYINLAW